MASLHRKVKTCFVFPDGEGGYVLKMQLPDMHGNNEQIEYELTVERAAWLCEQMAAAVQDMVKPKREAAT